MIFVVSGPSGCGKSTLIGRVLADTGGLRFSVSHTTRPKRGTEIDGRDYHFVTGETFEAMVRAGAFVEWAEVYGHRYGTSRAEIEAAARDVPSRAEIEAGSGDVVLDIDVQGARQIRRSGLPAKLVFVMPPVFAELKRRLTARGTDGPDAVARRLAKAGEEVLAYPEFDYVIVNEDLETAVGELRSIIRAEWCRPGIRTERIEAILCSFSGEERP
jgi:guanylate kinase